MTPDAGTSSVPIIAARSVDKTYRLGRVSVPVLRGVDLAVPRGEFLAILGASGSGKSTLLHLLGGLDRPDRRKPDGAPGGSILYNGSPIDRFSQPRLNAYRALGVGFVFQFYHLLPELSVLENVAIAGMIRGSARSQTRQRALELLAAFGLAHRLRHRPAELSGGERQRVAIARALVNDPPLLLADEPTGNLDRKTGSAILDSLIDHATRTQRTMIVVTHDPTIAQRARRLVLLEDGIVVPAQPLA